MPSETQDAINWALTENYTDSMGFTNPITKSTDQALVDAVRNYFNTNSIPYSNFSFSDLHPYL